MAGPPQDVFQTYLPIALNADNLQTAKSSWRGCGNHIPSAMQGVPQDQWCTCEARVTVDGKEYPAAAPLEIPGLSWIGSVLGGGKKDTKDATKDQSKDDL
jgi:hypothetical protein